MNLIGIDISLKSTSVCLETNNTIIFFNYTTEKPNNKWIKSIDNIVKFRFIEYTDDEKYSNNELLKIENYDIITNLIIDDILNNIDKNQETKINIEGYSYASNTNSVIDIVGFSTLLRVKLLNNVTKNINIISPKTVKVQTCLKVYGYQPAPIGKKGQTLKDPMITCNKEGVKGGDFEKGEMLKAMIDGNIQSPIFNYLLEHKDEFLSLKKVPKPFDDLVDSLHIKNIR